MTWWTWLILTWVIGAPITGGLFYFTHKANEKCSKFSEDATEHFAGHIIGAVLIFLLCIGTLVPCVQAIGNHQRAVSCHNWGIVNHRPSRYVVYNFWDTDCITPAQDGHWISTSQLTVNNVIVTKG